LAQLKQVVRSLGETAAASREAAAASRDAASAARAAAQAAAACAAELAEVKRATQVTAQHLHEIKRGTGESVDLQLGQAWGMWQDRARNPLTARPRRYWSQSDEDGILAEILLRLPESGNTFLEFGVDDGRENNTMALLAQRWRGVWVGAQELAFDPAGSPRLRYLREWVSLTSLPGIVEQARAFLGVDSPTVVSLDLDGNDYHFTEALLDLGVLPDVWVGEYNGRIPVGAEWHMPYSADSEWAGTDFFGVSFSSLCTLLGRYGYLPVACSVQGANAFFVRAEFAEAFSDVPADPRELYQPPMYFLTRKWGHDAAPETLQSIVQPPEEEPRSAGS
jgi:hypothetical protein